MCERIVKRRLSYRNNLVPFDEWFKMKHFTIGVIILEASLKATGLFSTVDCPPQINFEIMAERTLSSQIVCTMQLDCTTAYEYHEKPPCPYGQAYDDAISYGCIPARANSCEVKFKVTVIGSFDTEQQEASPCRSTLHPANPALLPHPNNCSLFYKCDWGNAVLFECPTKLHFNSELQVCDWPWQAGCDSSWMGCPRPQPRCPAQHKRPIYLPHPHLCDHFYQCDWGTPRLQICPTGLHFNPRLKVCDWPYNSKCEIC